MFTAKKYFFIALLLAFPGCSYSMLCPTNYNTIEFGYTIEKILELCGAPDQKSEYNETLSISAGVGSNQNSGAYYQNSNNYYSQGQGNYSQVHDVKEKVIVHTKLIYNSVQPTALFFEDGILKDRQLLTK